MHKRIPHIWNIFVSCAKQFTRAQNPSPLLFYATLIPYEYFYFRKNTQREKKSERFITTIMTDDDDDINDYQHPIDGLDHWVNLLKGNDFAFSYTCVSCSSGKEETEERKTAWRTRKTCS